MLSFQPALTAVLCQQPIVLYQMFDADDADPFEVDLFQQGIFHDAFTSPVSKGSATSKFENVGHSVGHAVADSCKAVEAVTTVIDGAGHTRVMLNSLEVCVARRERLVVQMHDSFPYSAMALSNTDVLPLASADPQCVHAPLVAAGKAGSLAPMHSSMSSRPWLQQMPSSAMLSSCLEFSRAPEDGMDVWEPPSTPPVQSSMLISCPEIWRGGADATPACIPSASASLAPVVAKSAIPMDDDRSIDRLIGAWDGGLDAAYAFDVDAMPTSVDEHNADMMMLDELFNMHDEDSLRA